MEKEQLIKKLDIFMNQARQANCYFLIIKQFLENRSNYPDEMSLSSAFYSFTYNALVVSTFMELAKIYDSHKYSTNIQKLFKECKENISYFPTFHSEHEITIDGKKHAYTLPFTHIVKEEEKDFFKSEIEKKHSFRELLGTSDLPFQVEMTIERFFDLYEWRLSKLELQIGNLLKQRNKVYAHNDEATMNTNIDDVIKKFSLNYEEIEKLIAFALDFCQFAYAMLTGINKCSAPINIDDWQNTLMLTKLGEKYQDIEVEKQVEDFKNSL